MAIKNFDKVQKEERKIQVGGEIADVSKIPSRVMLELMEASETGEISEDNPNSFKRTLELIEKVCKPSNPKITQDFLLDNTDFETLIELIQYVMEPVQQKQEEMQGTEGKNNKAQANKKPKK